MNEPQKTMENILSDFTLTADPVKLGAYVTLWIPADYKARYDELQAKSGKKFSKKVREIVKAAIDMAEAGAV